MDTGVSVDAGNIANDRKSTGTFISDRPDGGSQAPSLDKANSISSSQINIPTNTKGVGPAKSPPYCPGLYEPACCTVLEFGSGFRGKCKLCQFIFL